MKRKNFNGWPKGSEPKIFMKGKNDNVPRTAGEGGGKPGCDAGKVLAAALPKKERAAVVRM